jgi:hypothetical protein
MAGIRFLNPALKIILCALGMTIIGYYLYDSILAGATNDRMTIVRVLVFLGFTYLMIKSALELIEQKKG